MKSGNKISKFFSTDVEDLLSRPTVRVILFLVFGVTILCSVLVDQERILQNNLPTMEAGAADNHNIRLAMERYSHTDYVIHVAVVSCGLETIRLNEIKVLLKSCAMFTFHKVHMHIFCPESTKEILEDFFETWPALFRRRLEISYYEPFFPAADWEQIFRPCSTQRLFMHLKIPRSVEKVIYLDTDVIVVSPLEEVWAEFNKFGPYTQLAMALNNVIYNGWYDYHKEIPRPAKYPHGFNSGVLFMHLENIRKDPNWMNNIYKIAKEQKKISILFDQDLLNQYFSMFPDKYHKLPCTMNFRTDFCKVTNRTAIQGCPAADKTGAKIIHGNRFVFHSKKANAFQRLYDAFLKYDFNPNLQKTFLPSLRAIRKLQSGQCVYIHRLLWQRIKEYQQLLSRDISVVSLFPSDIYDNVPYDMRIEALQYEQTVKLSEKNKKQRIIIIPPPANVTTPKKQFEEDKLEVLDANDDDIERVDVTFVNL